MNATTAILVVVALALGAGLIYFAMKTMTPETMSTASGSPPIWRTGASYGNSVGGALAG